MTKLRDISLLFHSWCCNAIFKLFFFPSGLGRVPMIFLIPDFALSATSNSVNFPILPSWHGKRSASTSQAATGFFLNPCHCHESTVHSCFVLDNCWPVSSAFLPTSPSFKIISSYLSASYFVLPFTCWKPIIFYTLGRDVCFFFYMVV